jgi:hypothetical protein
VTDHAGHYKHKKTFGLTASQTQIALMRNVSLLSLKLWRNQEITSVFRL